MINDLNPTFMKSIFFEKLNAKLRHDILVKPINLSLLETKALQH